MQLTLDLQPDLLRQYPTLRDAVLASVYRYSRGLNTVAADCDMSPSELSRQLNRNQDDPRKLDIEDFDRILESTGDLLPLHWLIAKHLPDDEARRKAALSELGEAVAKIQYLLASAGEGDTKGATVARIRRG